MPTSAQRRLFSSNTLAVTAIIGQGGRAWEASHCRICRVACNPSSSGIITSIRIRSKISPDVTASTACCPSIAKRTLNPSLVSTDSITRRFISLSSATSTRPLRRTLLFWGGLTEVVKGSVDACSAGSVANGARTRNQKREPWPGAELTPASPPISLARLRTIDKPRPVPPNCRVVEPSTCEKRLNRRACCSAPMPIPVSVTENSSTSPCGVSSTTPTARRTLPVLVNLMALLVRLDSIWRKRIKSAK